MDKQLKKVLEELADGFVKDFRNSKFPFPKRIVFCTDEPVKNEELLFNYLENRFLNTQLIIDNPLPFVKIKCYYSEKHKQEGDYTINLSKYLSKFNFKKSQFLA